MNRIIQIEWKQFIIGDNQALEGLYKAHYSAMLATAYFYLKDKNMAEDQVADVFAKLLSMTTEERSLQLSNVNEKLDSFLKVLVKNRCLDHLKIENTRKNIITSIFDRFNRSNSNNAFLDQDFKLMLDVLPNRQREVLELHLEGYTNDEISVKLSVTYNTCRNTLSSAKKKVRQLWQVFMT